MLILKGIIIGIGKIIPGVSGSMLAISLGLYEQMIYSVNNFFKNPKENFIFLFKIFIGVSISIVFLSNIILSLLNNFYMITISLFIGLILGSLNSIKEESKNKCITSTIFLLVTIMCLITINNKVYINYNVFGIAFLFICGFIDAITMVIPGISGTAALMMIGVYDDIIKSLSTLFNFNLFENNLFILIPFILGMIVGIFITSKLVYFLFTNHKTNTYSAILGFSYSSILIMIIKCFNIKHSIMDIIFSILIMIIGFYMSKKINQNFD